MSAIALLCSGEGREADLLNEYAKDDDRDPMFEREGYSPLDDEQVLYDEGEFCISLLPYCRCPLTMLSRVCETVWCLSVCLSQLLQVCCCGPNRRDISIDCCSNGMQQADATLSAYVGSCTKTC